MEILATLVQKKRTFLQNAKTKKSVELGYRGGGPAPSASSGGSSKAFPRPGAGKFKATGKIDMTIEELKKVTKCGICKKTGHWWRECPHKDKEKEAHVLENRLERLAESEEALFCGHMELQPQEPDVSRSNRLSPRIQDHDHGVDERFLKEPTGHSAVRSAYKDRASEVLFHDHEAEGASTKGSVARNDPPLIRDHVIHDDECATIDTGCQRMAVGRDTLHRLADRLPDELPINLVRQGHRFRSVHGRSSTTHVADLPTSLGPNGSLLRPAVFDSEERRQAPFLLSLPFLMFCRATLVLDPEVGLKAHMKRLGVTFRVIWVRQEHFAYPSACSHRQR